MKKHLFALIILLYPILTNAQLVLSTPTQGTYTALDNIRLTTGFRTTGDFHAYLTAGVSSDFNYVRKRIYRAASQVDLTDFNSSYFSENIQYLDGLGRLIQNVQTKASPSLHDVVLPLAYDGYGREIVKYLPYADISGDGLYKNSPLITQSQYYSYASWDNAAVRTSAPYSQIVFENSPLSRVVELGGPGTVWQPASQRTSSQGRTILTGYATNAGSYGSTSTDYVARLWNAVPVTGADYKRTLSTSGYYNTGELKVKVIKDENWISTDGKAGTTEEYTDKDGRLILKRNFNLINWNIEVASTYYVYDDLGNLSFVLTPGSNPDAASISQNDLDNYCYQYRYDGKRRLIEKRIPAKGWEFMVYNTLDQLVLSQDSVQRIAGNWIYSKYDGLGRLAYSGLLANGSSRVSLESTVNSQTVLWERRQYAGIGYTSDAYPQTVNSYFSIQYYDDYSFPGISTYPYSASNQTSGLLTGILTNIIGTDTFLLTVNYYNDEGRVSKVFKQHYLSGASDINNYDETTNLYNFDGSLSSSIRVHHKSGAANTIIATRYDYDHTGRKLRTYEKINTDAEVLLVENQYNQTGNLKSKALHNGMQTTNYTYNERGWLKRMTSSEFSTSLKYEDGSVPQYNGNISGQYWGAGASLGNNLLYGYDKLNRLLSGAGNTMNESVSYDIMGNIQAMQRDGVTRLYTYSGNKLSSTSGAPGSGTYQYDGNGNATYDGRIEQGISYNVLNLPGAVSGLNLGYVYDASGKKLRKVSGSTVTDYIDGIQYENGSLQLIQTEAGVARNNGSAYSYEYNLTDHLGNVRYTFYRNPNTNQMERLQSDDYYPFGLRKSGSPVSLNNKYLYNGKELQDELNSVGGPGGQYDFGARFYDPVIGRWNVVDPMAELNRRFSPYVYGRNNPLIFVDPDGMFDEYFGLDGQRLGMDQNGVNGKIRIVTNQSEVDLIKENDKYGKITNSSLVSSGFLTSKTILSESLNVLNRTAGLKEEASTVTKEGVIDRMPSGNGGIEVVDGVQISSVDITIPKGMENTSIHSHIMDILKNDDGREFTMRATLPGINDRNVFKHFDQNIIVGNLKLPTWDGQKWVMPESGAVFYNRNGTNKGQLNLDALILILKR